MRRNIGDGPRICRSDDKGSVLHEEGVRVRGGAHLEEREEVLQEKDNRQFCSARAREGPSGRRTTARRSSVNVRFLCSKETEVGRTALVLCLLQQAVDPSCERAQVSFDEGDEGDSARFDAPPSRRMSLSERRCRSIAAVKPGTPAMLSSCGANVKSAWASENVREVREKRTHEEDTQHPVIPLHQVALVAQFLERQVVALAVLLGRRARRIRVGVLQEQESASARRATLRRHQELRGDVPCSQKRGRTPTAPS